VALWSCPPTAANGHDKPVLRPVQSQGACSTCCRLNITMAPHLCVHDPVMMAAGQFIAENMQHCQITQDKFNSE